MKKIALLCLIVIGLQCAYAKPIKFPRGCEATGFSFNTEQLVLNASKDPSIPHQTLFLIRNKTKARLHLKYEEQQDVLISPDWETELNRNRWAAFATDKNGLHFSCTTISRKHGNTLANCAEKVDVCQYPRAKFALSNKGDYWVATNKSLHRVVRAAINKGILLRW